MITSIKQQNLIQRWNDAKTELDSLKEKEAALRKEVLQEVYNFTDELREGTENVDLPNKFKLKAQFSINRKIDCDGEQLQEVIDDILEYDGGQFIVERLFKTKIELSTGEYKKLPDEIQSIVDTVLTSRPSMPQLSLIAPKAKR